MALLLGALFAMAFMAGFIYLGAWGFLVEAVVLILVMIVFA